MLRGIHWGHVFDSLFGLGFICFGLWVVYFVGVIARYLLRPPPSQDETRALRVWYRAKLWGAAAVVALYAGSTVAWPSCDPEEHDCRPLTYAEKIRALNNGAEVFLAVFLVFGFGTENETMAKKMYKDR